MLLHADGHESAGRGASELNHDDPSSFSPPAAFGPFRVLHQIGSGVLGPVFRTYEPERDRLVAVKAFRIDLLPEQAALLATELQAIVDANLSHPAIVQAVAAGMEGHLPYLAQEYVAAESLDVAMKHYAPAPPARVMPFLRQVAAAIDAAAASGVLHGGLHPRDVFLTTDEARTTGFGIVQAIENIGFRAPTRRPYTAPERVNGDEWGIEADVYSLGAIAHELLTGRRPAGPGDQDGSFHNDVPTEHRVRLRDVFARALAEDPAGRFSSATAFVDALEAASEGRHVDLPATTAAAAPAAAATAAAATAAAPLLFDTEEEPAPPPPEPAADVPIETTEDVEDIADVHGIEDVEDVDEVEDAHVEEEPVEPGADVWPPAGFSTSDLDITAEKETDEAVGDFDLDLNPADAVEVEHLPSPAEAAAALEAAEAFEYETSVEEDEARPGPAEPSILQAPAIIAPAAAAAAAPAAAPARSVESWRPSSTVVTPPPAGRTTKGMAALWIVAGVALGLLIGWAIFGGDTAIAPAPPQTAGAPDPAAPSASQPTASTTEVPVPEQPAAATTPTPAPAATPPPASRGSVLVRSTPANAMVVIDGVWTGRTPLTKRDLPLGDHVVRVVLDGYEPINRRVTLTAANASREMTFELRPRAGRRSSQPSTPVQRDAAAPRTAAPPPADPPASSSASLQVSSRPSGATVFVDGRIIGTAPARLAGLKPGSYHVRVELEGYQTWTTTVHITTAGQQARVAAPLIPQR